MVRWSFAVSVLVVAGCAVGSTSDANDFGVDKAPSADAGQESSVSYKPTGGGDDDDDTTPVDAGTKKDSGGGQTGACAFTGTLATWDLSALSGSTGQVNATSTANGVTGSALTRTGVTAASASGGYNSSGWPTGALDTSKYISIKLTAPGACALTASSVSVALQASGNGPSTASIATSADAYASKKTAGVAGTTSNVSVSADVGAGETLEIRVYGYQSVTTGGTLRANSAITVVGSTH